MHLSLLNRFFGRPDLTRFLAITLLVLIFIAAIGPAFATSRFVPGNPLVPRWVRTPSQPHLPVADLSPIAPIFQTAPSASTAQAPAASLGSFQIAQPQAVVMSSAPETPRWFNRHEVKTPIAFQPTTQGRRISYNVRFNFVGANGTTLAVPEPSGFLALAGPSLAGLLFWRRKRTI
jgi:hypothetical protein